MNEIFINIHSDIIIENNYKLQIMNSFLDKYIYILKQIKKKNKTVKLGGKDYQSKHFVSTSNFRI